MNSLWFLSLEKLRSEELFWWVFLFTPPFLFTPIYGNDFFISVASLRLYLLMPNHAESEHFSVLASCVLSWLYRHESMWAKRRHGCNTNRKKYYVPKIQWNSNVMGTAIVMCIDNIITAHEFVIHCPVASSCLMLYSLSPALG